MATLIFMNPAEWYEPGQQCEATGCPELATVRCEQTHQDDGESWALCTQDARRVAVEHMEWVALDGDGE